MHAGENEDKLAEFDATPIITRTQLLPAWFMILNGFVLVSGLVAISFFYMSLTRFLDRPAVPLWQTYQELILDFIPVLLIVPAFMFFIQRKPAAILGLVFGAPRLLVSFYGGPVMLINENFTILLWFGWMLVLLGWLIHVFRIRKRWNTARLDL